ncbi:response regulator transcription factor [Microlunatus sp. GCM10028923]|uniref:helix-turn-helix transcriptional regulator n=1 Tax=Microlunatus sp. GCM10028923 TaxID=3273400 RepID=UPI003614F842
MVFDLDRWASARSRPISWEAISANVLGHADEQPAIIVAKSSGTLAPSMIRRLVDTARDGRIKLAVLAHDQQDLPEEVAGAEKFEVPPFDRARAAALFDHRFGIPPFGPTLEHLLARTSRTYRVFCDLADTMARRDAFQERNGYLVARRVELGGESSELCPRYSWWHPGQEAPAGASDLVDLLAITGGADSIDVMEIFGVHVIRYLLRRGSIRMTKSERRVLPSSPLHGQIVDISLSLSRKFELYARYGQKLRRSCSDPMTAHSMWRWMTQLGRQPARGITAIAANRASATGADFNDPSDENATWRIAAAFRAAEERGIESALKYVSGTGRVPLNSSEYLSVLLDSGDYLGAESPMELGGNPPPDFIGHKSVVEALDLFRRGSIADARTIVRTLNLKRMSLRPLLLTAFMRLQIARICMDNRLADQTVQLIGSSVGWDRPTNSVAHFAAALNDIEQGRVNSAVVGAGIFLDSIRSDTRHVLRAPAEAIRAVGAGSAGVIDGIGSTVPATIELTVGTRRLQGLMGMRLDLDEVSVGRGVEEQLETTSPEQDPFLYVNLALTSAAVGVAPPLEAAGQALSAIDSTGLVAIWRRVLAAYGVGQVGPIIEAADELNVRGCCLESQRIARIAKNLLRQPAALNVSEQQQRSLNALAAPAWLLPADGARSRRLLTARETEVVEMLQEGLSDAKIAGLLGRSVRTVHAHVRNILSKLGASNRREAVEIWGRIRR